MTNQVSDFIFMFGYIFRCNTSNVMPWHLNFKIGLARQFELCMAMSMVQIA